jgi:pSer/pThr/pTyr-binding forkhead associated (FHA) protein
MTQLVSLANLHPALPLPDRHRPVLVIGRRPNCDVHLSDKRVSRVHAVLMLFEGSWYVEDLHSTNGTYVNGTRISQRVAVRRGDTLSFAGPQFRLSRPVTSSR